MIRCLLTSVTVMFALVADNAMAAASIRIYAVGDIAQCEGPASEAPANQTSRMIPDDATVITLGDSVYPLATKKYFASCYAPTWGRHLDHTIAVPGNHDYVNGSLISFSQYFGSHSDVRGYFTRRMGSWLLVGLDSNQSGERLRAQFSWLDKTLAVQAKDAACIAAFWHHALFSSGLHSGAGDHMRPAWEILQKYAADIVMSGHEHFYERFDPLNSDGRRDDNGIREFVVGTGGANLYGLYRPNARSNVRLAEHGVLALDIAAGSYAWEFRTIENRVADSGRATCHVRK